MVVVLDDQTAYLRAGMKADSSADVLGVQMAAS